MSDNPKKKIRFNIDRGGTFTDIYAEIVENEQQSDFRVLKLLSDHSEYENAPREGIRRILNKEIPGLNIGPTDIVPTSNIDWIRMATIVATNALLERNSDRRQGSLPPPKRVALVTTKGFRDLLTIGNQSRPNIFDLLCKKPELLFDKNFVFELDERIIVRPDLSPEDIKDKEKDRFQVCENGEVIEILQPFPGENEPEYTKLIENLKKPLEAGVTSIAILFIHSSIYPKHEEKLIAICRKLGFKHISASSQYV